MKGCLKMMKMDFGTKQPGTNSVAFEKANYLHSDFQVKEATKHTFLHGIDRLNNTKSISRSNEGRKRKMCILWKLAKEKNEG